MKQQFTGLSVEFPNFGTGPFVSNETYEINAASGLFNWNPPQIALVSYYDPNYNSVVTRSFAIGGSYGPTNISILTGSFISQQYAAATKITVFQNDVFASMPLGEYFPGDIGKFLERYGAIEGITNSLASSSTYSVRLLSRDSTPLLSNVTYNPEFLEEKGVDPNALYRAQGWDYPFTNGYKVLGADRGYLANQDQFVENNRTVADVIKQSLSRKLREIGSSVFGGWGNTTAAPMLGGPFNEAGGSPGYPPSTAQRMRAGR